MPYGPKTIDKGEWNKKQKAKQRELRCLPPFFLDTKTPFTNQTKFILLSWYNLNQKIYFVHKIYITFPLMSQKYHFTILRKGLSK